MEEESKKKARTQFDPKVLKGLWRISLLSKKHLKHDRKYELKYLIGSIPIMTMTTFRNRLHIADLL